MALQNHPSLYTGGLAKMDASPYIKAALTMRAQKAAKQEALDKYFMDLPNTLNSAGLRDEDIEGVNTRADGLRSTYIQNPNAIKMGGAAKYNYDKQLREAKSYIDKAKAKAKNLLEVGKRRMEKNSEHIFRDPKTIVAVEKASLPVDDPAYEPFDLATFQIAPRPFDRAANKKVLSAIKPDNETVTYAPHPTDPFQDVITRTPSFSTEKLNTVKLGALVKFNDSPSFEDEVTKAIANPTIKLMLTDVYKRYFGEEPDLPEEFAAAYDLNELMPPPEKISRETNQYRKTQNSQAYGYEKQRRSQRHAKSMAYLQDKLAKGRIAYKSAVSTGEQVNVLNTFWNNQEQNGSNKYSKIRIGGVEYQGKMVDIPKKLADKYVVKVDEVGADGKVYEVDKAPIGFYQTKDQIIPIYTTGRKTKSGNMEINATISKPESKQNYLLGISEIMLPQKERSLATDTEEEVFISEEDIETGVPAAVPRQGTSTPKKQTPKQSKPKKVVKGF